MGFYVGLEIIEELEDVDVLLVEVVVGRKCKWFLLLCSFFYFFGRYLLLDEFVELGLCERVKVFVEYIFWILKGRLEGLEKEGFFRKKLGFVFFWLLGLKSWD